MKRILYNIGIGAALLLTASACQEKEMTGLTVAGETVEVSFNVLLPQTKAYGDGGYIDRVIYEVYCPNAADPATPVEEGEITRSESGEFNLSLALPKNIGYELVLWAQNTSVASRDAYDIKNLKEIKIYYENIEPNADYFDAFYGSSSFTLTGSLEGTITLTRPFAQLNINDGAEDLAGKSVSLAVTNAGTVFNAATGAVSEVKDITFGSFTSGTYDETDKSAHLVMAYVLPSDYRSDISATFTMDSNGSTATLEVPGQTMTPNVRTNISAENLYNTIPAGNKSKIVTVSAGDITDNTYSITENGTYYLPIAHIEDLTVKVADGLDIVLDGKDGSVSGQLKVWYPSAVAHSKDSYNGTRTGSYTVKNFKAQVLSVATYKTTVNITDNIVECLDYSGGNVELNISGNIIDGNKSSHNITESSTDYGVYLYCTDYVLNFSGNTIKNPRSHAFAINGRESDTGKDVQNTNLVKAFAGNKIEVTNAEEDGRAAFKIWDDETYAPSSSNTEFTTEAAESLYYMILDSGNTFSKSADHTGTSFVVDFYGYKLKFIE
ncbi:MAG: hypothetical protein IJX11_04320 [Bacteroidales bacterium]|nr:hypothetical protein [Bacteroidales bacterium]